MPPFEIEYDVSEGYVEIQTTQRRNWYGKLLYYVTITDEETGAVHKVKTDEPFEVVYKKG